MREAMEVKGIGSYCTFKGENNGEQQGKHRLLQLGSISLPSILAHTGKLF